VSKLNLSPAWKALAAHQKKMAAASLTELFAADASRAGRFSIEAGELMLDYSKHRVDAETMRLLAALAAQAQLPGWIARMFAGDRINSNRGARRAPCGAAFREYEVPRGLRRDARGARRSRTHARFSSTRRSGGG